LKDLIIYRFPVIQKNNFNRLSGMVSLRPFRKGTSKYNKAGNILKPTLGDLTMNIIKKTSMVIALLGIFIAFGSFGIEAFAQDSGSRRQGPPPEAYTACEGKSAGSTAEFESPEGDTVTGTCEQDGDRLVLRPDRSKGNSGGRRHSPPPEAYTACEGNSAGDTAEFESPSGETVTGTCEEDGDRLVLRPDNPPGKGRRNNTDG
jgi:hypothetical protein